MLPERRLSLLEEVNLEDQSRPAGNILVEAFDKLQSSRQVGCVLDWRGHRTREAAHVSIFVLSFRRRIAWFAVWNAEPVGFSSLERIKRMFHSHGVPPMDASYCGHQKITAELTER
jgi:hypothetical protein